MEFSPVKVLQLCGLCLSAIAAGCGHTNLSDLPTGQSQVTATHNPLVALYTIQPPSPATVFVEFGSDTNYGRATSTQATPGDGSPLGIYVAGMRANTTYHMRAVIQFADGRMAMDPDHTFKTSSFDPKILPAITV